MFANRRMTTKTESESPRSPVRPRLSLLIATCFGLGYLPPLPGTWASLVGLILYWGLRRIATLSRPFSGLGPLHIYPSIILLFVVPLVIALVGVWAASRVEKYAGLKDPQLVVIDEVSGQLFTYLFAFAPPNWEYLLLGLILFRGFDIRKPSLARQAETLPRGWGIMADDWVAAVYAAVGLWIARGLGL